MDHHFTIARRMSERARRWAQPSSRPRAAPRPRRCGQAGIDAIVEATPTGLGRDPAGVARISAATGLHVVHATGAHRTEHYGRGHWLTECSDAELTARFTADVRDGLPAVDARDRGPPATGPSGAPVRAGLVKAGVGYWRIDAFERRVLAAAAATAASTGVTNPARALTLRP